MIGGRIEKLPEDLQAVAKHISTTAECKCDLSVGVICESCTIYALMVNAAKEINRLRDKTSERPKIDREHLLSLPVAEFTHATFTGKNLYIIAGLPGLYSIRCHRDKGSKIIYAKRSGKGWKESAFARNKEAEERLGVKCE